MHTGSHTRKHTHRSNCSAWATKISAR